MNLLLKRVVVVVFKFFNFAGLVRAGQVLQVYIVFKEVIIIIYNLKGLIKFNRGGERGGVSSGSTLGGTTTLVYS